MSTKMIGMVLISLIVLSSINIGAASENNAANDNSTVINHMPLSQPTTLTTPVNHTAVIYTAPKKPVINDNYIPEKIITAHENTNNTIKAAANNTTTVKKVITKAVPKTKKTVSTATKKAVYKTKKTVSKTKKSARKTTTKKHHKAASKKPIVNISAGLNNSNNTSIKVSDINYLDSLCYLIQNPDYKAVIVASNENFTTDPYMYCMKYDNQNGTLTVHDPVNNTSFNAENNFFGGHYFHVFTDNSNITPYTNGLYDNIDILVNA